MYHVADRQPDSVQRLRQQAGWAVHARPEQQPPGEARPRTAVVGADSARHVALGRPAARAAGRFPIPVDNNIVWATGIGFGSVGGTVERFDERTAPGARGRDLARDHHRHGVPADREVPLQLDVSDRASRRTITTRCTPAVQHVHARPTAARRWQDDQPGPDAERQEPHQQRSGGLTPDNIGVEYAGVVFAIAESPREKGVIWAGTNDGLVQVTRDGGAHWTNVTANIPGPAAAGARSATSSRRASTRATAYVTVDLHQVNNRDPFVYKTTDYGRTGSRSPATSPRACYSYAHCVREDPVQARAAVSRHRERAVRLVRRRRSTGSRCSRACRTRRCTG